MLQPRHVRCTPFGPASHGTMDEMRPCFRFRSERAAVLVSFVHLLFKATTWASYVGECLMGGGKHVAKVADGCAARGCLAFAHRPNKYCHKGRPVSFVGIERRRRKLFENSGKPGFGAHAAATKESYVHHLVPMTSHTAGKLIISRRGFSYRSIALMAAKNVF